MDFLSGSGTIWVAASLTIPPLVLLYFLKLRRQEIPISSTFFWKRAVQDLQVNAPFQRLRNNLLLLLQLLVLLLCAIALAQPVLNMFQDLRASYILLIDRSASMNVVEADGRTRLQRAKAAAQDFVEQLDPDDRAMIVAFSDRASIMEPFTTQKDDLVRSIDAITPSDGLSRLSEAISLAKAHSQIQIVEMEGMPGLPPEIAETAQTVIFTDGRIEDAATVVADRLELEMVNVAESTENVGIVSLSASRYYERPELLNVVAGIQNFGTQQREVDVELYIDDQHMDIKTVQLPASKTELANRENDVADSMQIVSFDQIEYGTRGILRVTLSDKDALAADNQAFAILDPPRDTAVLLVSSGNPRLERLLRSERVYRWHTMTPEEYEAAADAELIESGRARYDVVIFDNVSTDRLPRGSYLFLGGMPMLEGFAVGELRHAPTVFNWNESHPIMRHVYPDTMHIIDWHEMKLPAAAFSLIDARDGSLVSLVSQDGSQFLMTAFALLQEDGTINTVWLFRVHFVVFMFNALQYLSGNIETQISAQTRPGDALAIESPPDENSIAIDRPDGTSDSVLVGNLNQAHYGKTDRVGLYRAHPTRHGETLYAVNLLSPSESNVRPNQDLRVAGERVPGSERQQRVNVPVWPWLLAGALAVLLLEWVIYCRRIRV